jgi:hypothetical protein
VPASSVISRARLPGFQEAERLSSHRGWVLMARCPCASQPGWFMTGCRCRQREFPPAASPADACRSRAPEVGNHQHVRVSYLRVTPRKFSSSLTHSRIQRCTKAPAGPTDRTPQCTGCSLNMLPTRRQLLHPDVMPGAWGQRTDSSLVRSELASLCCLEGRTLRRPVGVPSVIPTIRRP